MNRGYVKIYRCIEDNILWRTDEPFCKRAAWEDLILLANHDDNSFMLGNQKMVVKRGQHWTANCKLQKRWRWSENKVRSFLKFLQDENMIYLETNNRGSMITLVNYGKYQDFKADTKEQKGEQKREQKGEQKKIRRRTDKGADGGANGGQTIMTNNDIKNDIKNESKNEKKPAAQFDFFVEE